MQNVIARSLSMLIVLLSLNGCTTTRVNNSLPDPYFPTCADIDVLAKPAVPDSVVNTQVESTNVMLKLRDRQAPADQQKLGGCHAGQ